MIKEGIVYEDANGVFTFVIKGGDCRRKYLSGASGAWGFKEWHLLNIRSRRYKCTDLTLEEYKFIKAL